MTPDFVVNGFHGTGMPHDWWANGKLLIDAMMRGGDDGP